MSSSFQDRLMQEQVTTWQWAFHCPQSTLYSCYFLHCKHTSRRRKEFSSAFSIVLIAKMWYGRVTWTQFASMCVHVFGKIKLVLSNIKACYFKKSKQLVPCVYLLLVWIGCAWFFIWISMMEEQKFV